MDKKFPILLALIIFSPLLALGQGVCVIAEQAVSKIEGSVRIMNSEDYVKNAKLKLRDAKDKTRIISERVADEKGWFKFGAVDNGKYVLIVSGEDLKTLYIPVEVTNTGSNAKLQISLGGLIGVPCGGGGTSIMDSPTQNQAVNRALNVERKNKPLNNLKVRSKKRSLTSSLDLNRTGTLVGTAIFVDAKGKTFVKEAVENEIKLRFNEESKVIKTDFKGDFILSLPVGRYCLLSVTNKDGQTAEISPEQSNCFTIKANADTRFDIMLLDGKTAMINIIKRKK